MQIAVGERQQTRIHPALIALFALLFQIHLVLRGNDGLDIVGLFQRFHAHIVVNHQVNVFQIGAGKPILGHLSDASVLRIAPEQARKHRPNLAFSFSAAALDEHHPLSLVAGNQAVSDVLLQAGNILGIQQLVEETQPDGRRRSVRGVTNGKTASHNLVLFVCKPTVQKERSVCKVNPIRLWGKLVHVRRDFKQLDDAADFLGDAGGSVVFQHRVNIGFERRVIRHTAFRRKEGIFRVEDVVCFQKMLAKQGFIDGFPVEPCRPAVKRQDGFLLFQVQTVPPLCNVSGWFGCVEAHPC